MSTGQFCTVDADCDPGEFCEKLQADTYPPGGNGIGDACDCEGNFDCDVDVDGAEVTAFLLISVEVAMTGPVVPSMVPAMVTFSATGMLMRADVTKFLEDFGRGVRTTVPVPTVMEVHGVPTHNVLKKATLQRRWELNLSSPLRSQRVTS